MREQDKKPAIVAEVPDEMPMEKELRRSEEEARATPGNGEPRQPPIEEPKPDVQPEQIPPDNPQEDRPLHDPLPPNTDLPRM